MDNWVVYILKCADGSFYCGTTNKLVEERIKTHNTGKGSKYTRARLPVELVECSVMMSKSLAYSLEYKIKKLPRNKKIDFLIQNGTINKQV